MSEPAAPNPASPEQDRSIAARVVWVALALGAAVLVLWAEDVPPRLAKGQPAPAFELEKLSGGSLALESLRGHVVLINIWATWCKPCEDEMPAMERLYQGLSGSGFELLAVSIDDERDPVEAFQARYRLGFPILLDPDQGVSRLYQTTGVPESILVDAEGRVVERYIGPREWDDPLYAGRIRELLGGAEAAAGSPSGS
ncbi:MAG: TlpA family protein disulfide reductase [Proteobacteria bacterium]|nr:TlpA family protein disulfide reductase [Pseudomonadota bacterium]